MSDARKRFRYPLEPLLKQYGWEIDTLRTELGRLNALLEEEEHRMSQISARISDAEQGVRAMQQSAAIEPGRIGLAHTYLKQQHEILRGRRSEAARVGALRDQTLRQLSSKKQMLKTLERHKDRKLTEKRAEDIKTELAEADWQWLARSERAGGR